MSFGSWGFTPSTEPALGTTLKLNLCSSVTSPARSGGCPQVMSQEMSVSARLTKVSGQLLNERVLRKQLAIKLKLSQDGHKELQSTSLLMEAQLRNLTRQL